MAHHDGVAACARYAARSRPRHQPAKTGVYALWLVESGAAEAFRTRIKAVELEAERLQQEAMYRLATAAVPLGSEATSPEAAARGSIAAYEAMCASAFPKPATETLLAAFMRLEPTSEE